MSPLRLYHGVSGHLCGNAGDLVSAPLLDALGFGVVEVVAEPENAQIFAAGSILHQVPIGWPGLIFGSGLIQDEDRVKSAAARYVAVRGPLTAKRCRVDVPMGDPGLLVSMAWPADSPRRYRLGIIPHYVDREHEGLAAFARRNPDEVTTIDICGRLADVLRAVTECEYILSSSLHGLVFADSYGIPNAWIKLGNRLVGGSFKFRDYYGATLGEHDPIPIPFETGETVETMIGRIEEVYRDAPVVEMGDALVEALAEALVEVEPVPPDEEPTLDETEEA